ncbi:MAG TPA: aminopeptidase [Candidatus Limnocylindria bacterium]|nr:aminopeptidase [Candidatus Limnocylindria bacterium]
MSPSAPTTSVKRRRFRRHALIFLAVAVFVTGCNTVGYYQQAAAGQYEIFSKQEPISAVLARPDTNTALREKLQLVLDIREFAERELSLKTDGHYASYADLGRRFVVWNVYAAPEFSLEPKKWWYPVVGKLKYRGFFSEKDARKCGARLVKDGYDVYVGGVDAYSTLGWFKDPVLNTFIDNTPTDLAEILFHELAHQRVFAKGDTDFNEAFATAVGEEGVRRWMAVHGDAKTRADYETQLRRKDQFVALVMQAREDLKQIYGEESAHAPRTVEKPGSETLVAAKRSEKEQVIAKLRADYEQLKAGWGGYAGYDHWFKRPINNAQLNTVAAYYTLVPAFQQLLAQNNGDLPKFYAEAKALSALKKEQRLEQMTRLAKAPPNAGLTVAR